MYPFSLQAFGIAICQGVVGGNRETLHHLTF